MQIIAALIVAAPLAWLALEIRLARNGYVARPGAKPKKPAKATPPERTDYA